MMIKYGAKKYDVTNFIKKTVGKIDNIDDSINTLVIGKHRVDVTLKKFNITRNVSFYVDVVDVEAPVIELKEQNITITKGESLNVLDNVNIVKDDVDGEIEYTTVADDKELKDIKYYTVNTNFDNNVSGNYEVEVKAVDNSNNVSTATFTVTVEEPVITYHSAAQATSAAVGFNSSGSNIVDLAYSLLGRPYVSGGTSPSGFDCSGFVQYVYAQNGISISRSVSTQVNDGVGIPYNEAQPGDILIWGYSNGVVTHSALFVGNDQMIHAANPSTGVILSSVSGWTRGSDVQILYVRRIAS